MINSLALERAGDNHREGRKMANRENKISVILYEDTIDALIAMPDGSMSKVMKSILCRAKGKESPELDALESVIFRLLYGQVERASNLSDERAKAGASKGKKAAQAQTEDTGNQNVSNDEQTEATDKQIEANAIKAEAKPNTITSTSTVTKTKTSTVTDTSTSTGGVGEDECTNVIYLPPEPEFTGQVFDGNPPAEGKALEEISACWRKHIGEPTPALYHIARSWMQSGMEAALICRGIEQSVPAKDAARYLHKVLSNWKKEGILTLAACEAAHPGSLPKFSGQAYGRAPSRGNDGLCQPSYDLGEVNRLLNQEILQKARGQGIVV